MHFKGKWKKRLLSFAMATAMSLSVISVTAFAYETAGIGGSAAGAGYSYMDENGELKSQGTATVLSTAYFAENGYTLSDGWYVVGEKDDEDDYNTVIASDRIVVSGEVHLILLGDFTLNALGGINVSEGNSLTIYGQDDNSGAVFAGGGDSQAGIGGENKQSAGTITINSGTVIATGGNYGAGIGGGFKGSGGTVTINGGTVTATGGRYGAGIGGGDYGAGGTVTINGGTVTATGGRYGAGIGGAEGSGGTVTINGGTVTATGGVDGAGIGGGSRGAGGTVTISGGTVTATGVYGAGIGDGYEGAGGTVTISGGTVTATGGIGGDGNGTFSTGTNGTAVITASSIGDATYKTAGETSGIIFDGDEGQVYGGSDKTFELTDNLEITSDKTLVIPDGVTLKIASGKTLTNNGKLVCLGTVSETGTGIVNNGTILIAKGTAPALTGSGVVMYRVSQDSDLPVDCSVDIKPAESVDAASYTYYTSIVSADTEDLYAKEGTMLTVTGSYPDNTYDSIGCWLVNDTKQSTKASETLTCTMGAEATEIGFETHTHEWIIVSADASGNIVLPDELITVLKKEYNYNSGDDYDDFYENSDYAEAYINFIKYINGSIAIVCVGDGDCGETTYSPSTDSALYRTGGRLTLKAPGASERNDRYYEIYYYDIIYGYDTGDWANREISQEMCHNNTNTYSGNAVTPDIQYDNEEKFKERYKQITGLATIPTVDNITYMSGTSSDSVVNGNSTEMSSGEVPINAGYYKATLSVNYTTDNADKKTLTANTYYNISRRKITVKADEISKTYGVADPVFTYTVVDDPDVSDDGLAECDEENYTSLFTGSLARISGENVGTYDILQGTLALKSGSNYTVSGTWFTGSKLTIDQAEVEAPEIDSKEYTGEVQTAVVPESTLYEVVENEGGTDAGTYDVKLALTDSTNYKWKTSEETDAEEKAPEAATTDTDGASATITVKFNITKAENSWVKEPSIADWTYRETASVPSTGEAKFGSEVKVEYKLASAADSAYSTTVPEAAGDYKVRFTVAGTTNYDELTKVVDLEIKKAAPNLTVDTQISKTYGDETFTLSASQSGDGTIGYKSSDDKVLAVDSAGKVTIIGAGEATITVSVNATDNYESDSKTVTVRVARNNGNLTINDVTYNVTYGDADFSIGYGVEEETGVTFASDDKSVAKVDDNGKITIVGAGEATITVTAAQSANYNAATKTVTVKVAQASLEKADIELDLPDGGYVYDGTSKMPAVTVKVAGKTLQSGKDYQIEYQDNVKFGTAKVVVKATEGGNYTGSAETEFAIGKGNPDIKVEAVDDKTYGDDDFELEVEYEGNGKLSFSSDNEKVLKVDKYGNVSIVGAGTATITVSVAANVNYDSAEKSVQVTVNKAATAPNAPASALIPEHTVKTVADVNLPTDWQWSENDKNTELADNEPVKATANYIGKDAGNYEIESVEITITRQPCEHKGGTESVDKVAATCIEAGYTGDTVCEICGEVIEGGEEIPATGHSYKSEITKEATAKEEGEITYTCLVCGDTYTESIPVKEVEPPYIAGDAENQGWDAIRNETKNAIAEVTANPGEEKTVTVIMNGAVEVPADIFEQIKGKDVTIVFVMDNGIKWSVDGNSVTGDNIKDINFKVYTYSEANEIPDDVIADVINNVTGEYYEMNLTLAYEGEFGFTAVMNIGLEEEYAGYYANLFYHNKTTNKLEFICADRIALDGTANLTFTHASDYVIIIDEESLDPDAGSVEDPSENPDDEEQKDVEKPPVATPSDATPSDAEKEPDDNKKPSDDGATTEAPAEDKPTTEAPTTATETPVDVTEAPTTAAPADVTTSTTATTTATEAPVDVTEAPTTAAPADVTTATEAPATVTPATTEANEGAAPKTGDESKAPVAVLLLLLSEIGIALSVMLRKKRG
jgi:hypothetical protein